MTVAWPLGVSTVYVQREKVVVLVLAFAAGGTDTFAHVCSVHCGVRAVTLKYGGSFHSKK